MVVFTTAESVVIQTFSMTLSIFSLIGEIFIITSYYFFPKLRKFSFKLVLFMSLADVGATLSYFLGDPKNDGSVICGLQAWGEQMFQLSSMLWSTAIALTLYRAVVSHKETDELMKYLHLLCFGLPFFLSFMPLTTDDYGTTGAWCWIKSDEPNDSGFWWRIFIFYIPLWASIVFNAYSYYLVRKAMTTIFKVQTNINGEINNEIPEKYKTLMKRLRLYPLILVGCW